MKKIVFLAAVVTGYAALAANTWYVDAENGNDDWDGKADFANADPDSKVGPKKTLGVFTEKVSNGDTIYVAPGYYTNGVAGTSRCRFYTTVGGISLISTGCATNTFIWGAADKTVAQDSSPFGCGSNAIIPVKMLGSDNTIKGITIANGRQVSYDNNQSYYGGGVVFANDCTNNKMVDCVVTNCIAQRGGGVVNLNYALRCRFVDNYAAEGAHALNLASAINCIFENTDGYAVYNQSPGGGMFLNCLCRGNKTGNFRSGSEISVYNSVFLLGGSESQARNKNCYFRNCFFDYDTSKVAEAERVAGKDDDCRTLKTEWLRFTSEGVPMRMNPVIGAAKAAYYNDNFPSELEPFGKDCDVTGDSRTQGGAMDIGAVEHITGRVYPNDWFVDERNGDDSNSGKTADLAKKTLVAIMEGRDVGEVVHAAPGVYSNGTVTVGSQDFRVNIPAGVSLVGSGADNTVILGKASENPDSDYGTGPGAISCVYMSETDENTAAGLYGFTLSGGCSSVKSGDSSRGSAVKGSSLRAGVVADCVITNCATARGPVYKVGAVVRCRFIENVSVEGAGGAILDVNCIYDSYFRNNLTGYNGSNTPMHDIYQTAALMPDADSGFVMNCTFDSTGKGGPHTASATGDICVYNSIVKTSTDEGGACYTNSVVTISGSASTVDPASVVTNREAVALTKEAYRPVVGFNPSVGKGDYVYYTNLAPFAISRIIGKDLWGNPRLVNGVLDIGAVSCDRAAVKVSDSSTGLDVGGLEKDGFWHDAEENAEFTLSRNYTSPKLLRGVYVNGTYVDFNAHEDGWNYVGTLPSNGTFEIVPDYAKVNDWYVDANLGNDSNDGLRPGASHAFKTLARASTNSLVEAGATVYVAEGVYNIGVVPALLYGLDSTDNRMVVPYGVHFIASGDRDKTIVEGASSSDTACGIGNGAVRCCIVRGGSVQGFTMRNGNVNASSSSTENDQGGGIRFTSGDAFAYDCEIYNCNAVRGGGVASGASDQMKARLVRCYIHDNTVNTEGLEPKRIGEADGAYRCSGYNTVVEGNCYVGKTWLNSTITGKCWGSGTTFYNCFIGADGASGAGVAATFTNCVTSGTFMDHSKHEGCWENKTYTFSKNKNWRPRSKDSALFNTGDGNLYAEHFPADLAAYANFDYAGGDRILEGAIDVGAGEMIYDPTGTQIIFR